MLRRSRILRHSRPTRRVCTVHAFVSSTRDSKVDLFMRIAELTRGATTQGAIRSGRTVVAVRRNSNRRTHSLEAGRPWLFGGLNFQLLAACKASPAKYLLGPGESSIASA